MVREYRRGRQLWARQPIAEDVDADSVAVVDLDGDGDLDILSATYSDGKIGWYENTDGAGDFSRRRQVIATYPGITLVRLGDIDGDGDLDLFGTHSDATGIVWYENTDGDGSFGTRQGIGIAGGSASLADLDGDGDLDVLYTTRGDATIGWYENVDGLGSFGPQRDITTDFAKSMSAGDLYTADLDGDGDVDVLASSGNRNVRSDYQITWFENVDGIGTFAEQQVITSEALSRSVHAADLDGDGDMDVLSAETRSASDMAWFENTDGVGGFGPSQEITTGAIRSVEIADLDGDGDLDILSSADDKIAWYESEPEEATPMLPKDPLRFVRHEAAGFDVSLRGADLHTADIDGDGDFDLVAASGSQGQMAWYENTEGAGRFGPRQVVTTELGRTNGQLISIADLDGDGDLDVISVSSDKSEIIWHENTDGAGTFEPQPVAKAAGFATTSLQIGDVDSDGDGDILLSSTDDIILFENRLDDGAFGPPQVIDSSEDDSHHPFGNATFGDLDGDGDLDILSAEGEFGQGVFWYENIDGKLGFGAKNVSAIRKGQTYGARWQTSMATAT